jgi:hypothetical protein
MRRFTATHQHNVKHVCRQCVAIEFLSSLLLAGVPVLLLAQLRHKREKVT